jgi:hypothetical protein
MELVVLLTRHAPFPRFGALWDVRGGGSETGTMSDEFDSLDANEKAALKGALVRSRALLGRIESALSDKTPGHVVTEQTVADFCTSLERAADILQKGRR